MRPQYVSALFILYVTFSINIITLYQIDDYSMVSFLPLNPCDEDSITNLLLQIDNAIQYGEDLDVREMKVTNSNSCSLIFLI